MKMRSGNLAMAFLSATLLLVALHQNIQKVVSQVTSPAILISEVAWAGTQHSPTDEWIELYNAGDSAADLSGWILEDSSGDLTVLLQGELAAGEYFLLERTADDTISNITADQIYHGGLNNVGETITLFDGDGAVVDTANSAGGEWIAGEAAPDYVSMERASTIAADDLDGWVSNDRYTRSGLDSGGNPINGTPHAANSSWIATGDELADLMVSLQAPDTVAVGDLLYLSVTVANIGAVGASNVVITASLPASVHYIEDDSDLDTDLSTAGAPVWSADNLLPGASLSFVVTAEVAPPVSGLQVIGLQAYSASEESEYANNWIQSIVTIVAEDGGLILIGALLYDGYELGDLDEAVQLLNTSATDIDIGGWRLSDGSQEAELPDHLIVRGYGSIWLARDAGAFSRQFGFLPEAVIAPWPGFANAGDEVILKGADGAEIDSLVYKDGNATGLTWQGAAVWPYRVSGIFAEEGQLLFRRRYETNGRPVADSNSAGDWAQSHADPVLGRKLQYPGWNPDAFRQPVVENLLQEVTIGVAPDNAFELVVQQIERAQHSILIQSLTFENTAIGSALMDAAARGVEVKVLLEGAPATGIANQERYICQQLEKSGAACWFMIRDDERNVHDRYRYLHAKFMIIDGIRAVISSENLSPSSMPDDDKADGTWGRRGLVLVTRSTVLVRRLMEIFNDDLDETRHQDLFRWSETHPVYGGPPDGYIPITVTGGMTYTVRYPQPVTFHDVNSVGLFQAPENILRSSDGLLALLQMAGPGDIVRVQQLTERAHWGTASSDPMQDPNPRLEAYIDAARRGATVRIMLDAYFDRATEPLSNASTCDYVLQIAAAEGLRLRCVLANPSGLGIHNKLVLLKLSDEGWIHVGSWNGTEQSTKGNREIALQIQSNAAHDYLAALFEYDWPHQNWLPLVVNQFRGAANYPLISEILYDTDGPDDGEFIELNNPTPDPIDLSGWTISDAVLPEDFEDARRFPEGATIAARSTLVVALSASHFESTFGYLPDFEILNSRPDVADLIDDIRWGDPAAILQMANGGDEVLLRSPAGIVVDAITYGTGSFPGVVGCPTVETSGSVLERIPYWHDSNDCTQDFRIWPFPSPGQLP